MYKIGPQLLEAWPLIIHTNAQPLLENIVSKNLREYGWKMLPHVAYLPDMIPLDFHLFSKLTQFMWQRPFPILEELPGDDTRAIRQMNRSDALDGIVKFPKLWIQLFRIRQTILTIVKRICKSNRRLCKYIYSNIYVYIMCALLIK